MTILSTERLILREMTPQDAENIFLLNFDPDVIRYTGDVSFSTIQESKTFLENYTHYQKYGFGRWAVIRKADNIFLGWCGLKYSPESNEFDIGYRFFKKYWGNGYASEAAKACIAVGFEKFNIKVIIGQAMKENLASIRVFEKIGLHFFKNSICGEESGVTYYIENPNLK